MVRNFKLNQSLIWPLVMLAIAAGVFIFKPWQTKPAQTISVSGQGQVEAAPDIARISGTVQSQGPTAQSAQNQNQLQTSTLIDSLKQVGVNATDIQTANVTVNPQYNYQQQPPQIISYTASTTITVKIKNLEKSNDVLTALTAGGVTSIFGPNLEVDNQKLEAAKSQARQKAIENAKSKAQQLATDADRKLGKIVAIKEENTTLPQPIPLAIGGQGMVARPPQIQPGQNEVTINLQVDFALK